MSAPSPQALRGSSSEPSSGQLPPTGSPSRAISPQLSSKNGSLVFSLGACPQISVSNTASWDMTSGRPLGSQEASAEGDGAGRVPLGGAKSEQGPSPSFWDAPTKATQPHGDSSALPAQAEERGSPPGAPPFSATPIQQPCPQPPSWALLCWRRKQQEGGPASPGALQLQGPETHLLPSLSSHSEPTDRSH